MENLIKYRKANLNDVAVIIDLGEMLQDESKEFEPKLAFDKKEATDNYRAELDNIDALIIVAEANDSIVGYMYSYVTKLDYLSSNNVECVFEAIYVLPEYRSRGIATKLESMSENWAVIDKKVNRIKANIYNGNIVSEKIHLKNGFTPYCSQYLKLIE